MDRNPCARIRLLFEENTRTRVMTEGGGTDPRAGAGVATSSPQGLNPRRPAAGRDPGLALGGCRSRAGAHLHRPPVEEPQAPRSAAPERARGGAGRVIAFRGARWRVALLFVDPLTAKPYQTHDVVNHFKASVRRARIRDLRFHDLRRTFASRLAQRGVTLQAIARLLGHGATYVTERYAHLSCDDLREAMLRLSEPKKSREVGRFLADSAPVATAGKRRAQPSVVRKVGGGGRI